jgi:hypothetical protein
MAIESAINCCRSDKAAESAKGIFLKLAFAFMVTVSGCEWAAKQHNKKHKKQKRVSRIFCYEEPSEYLCGKITVIIGCFTG